MKHSLTRSLFLFFVPFLVVACDPKKESSRITFPAGPTHLMIGTGGINGVYYPLGGAITKMVNKKRDVYRIKAGVETTDGSVYNLNALIRGELEVGIVQSDRGYQAWNGLADWFESGRQTRLRSLFSLHKETVTLIVADDSRIHTCADLASKKIVVGQVGSGTRKNAADALSTCGLTFEDIVPEEIRPAEAATLLQNGKIDGYFFTIGHPSKAIKDAIAGKKAVRFVPFTNLTGILAANPYYTPSEIPIGDYQGIKNIHPVPTFGVIATVVTTEEVSEEMIYAVTKEVFSNFEFFKGLHPALSHLNKNQMFEGLAAPLHDGAKRYYEEVGIQTSSLK